MAIMGPQNAYASLKYYLLPMKSSQIYGHYDNSASSNECYLLLVSFNGLVS